jgi:UDP-3-O-[3-hydroxymyristoyl] glucosamine N-acyltransferase
MQLNKLADLLELEWEGDGIHEISSVAEPEKAKPDQLIYIKSPKFKAILTTTQAGVVILPPSLADAYQGNKLITKDPYLAYAKAASYLHPVKKKQGIHPTAVIHGSAVLGERVFIGPHVVIDEACQIGDDCSIGAGSYLGDNVRLAEKVDLRPNVTIAENTRIGANTLIHSGAVIGSDGFGFAPQADKAWYKIPQLGRVIIGEDVEIGANTTIDNGALGDTVIGDGVKIDNLLQIGHNVKIGNHSALASHTAIAGSAKIGQYCQIGGATAIAGHLEIADNSVILGTSTVTHTLKDSGVYSSAFAAADAKKWRRNVGRFAKLDEIYKRLLELEEQLSQLKNQTEQ